MDSRTVLYNDLHSRERSRKLYPVHKKLIPFSFRGHLCSDVNDLWDALGFAASDRLLDLGCGVGNTLITLSARIGLSGMGISISNEEVEAARRNAIEAGVSERCRFYWGSFDAPFEYSYTRAIAIESVKHSHDLQAAAHRIFSQAEPDSFFYLVDDCFTGSEEGPQERQLMKDWALIRLFTAGDFIGAFTAAGFQLEDDLDLTPHVIPRSLFLLQAKILLFSFLIRLPLGKVRRNLLSVYRSGFILEKLFAQKKMTYRLLVFRNVQRSASSLPKEMHSNTTAPMQRGS